MERRGEESMDFGSPQESPAELFPGQQHGGSSIFSSAQTLDPRPAALLQNGTTPNSDPPISASDSKNQPPPPPPLSGGATTSPSSIRYKECLKNHAAGMGGHVVDGCGEFMPAGDPNTPQALRCAACDCHRNFHRREPEGSQSQAPPFRSYTYTPNSGQTPLPTHPQPHHRQGFAAGPTLPTMMSFGGNSGGAAMESSSEDLNIFQSRHGRHAAAAASSKKRFRTKFSQDQKDRMREFATKIDWRLQKQDEEDVQEFCNQVGVKRKAFKVWMHNNKQAMKKKTSET